MLPYQTEYIENTARIAVLTDLYAGTVEDFDRWYRARLSAREEAAVLRQRNIRLLNDHLFPALDRLPQADEDTIADLVAFGDKLMDWSTNLDCGVYVLIHDALLSLCRIRRDRNGTIRELYRLGMGLYYQGRAVDGIETWHVAGIRFRNEMVFTEAGAYLKYYGDIDDQETRGYIIRGLANIAIATQDMKRRIATSARVLNILQDDYYRALAPGLPWDTFIRRTHQQMSSNRHTLSRGNLSTAELAAVLESCHEVFEAEKQADHPNIRWQWPYYEMEYSCGFVDLPTTLRRLERLINSVPWNQYDVAGLYGNIQLPVYYGRLLRENPALLEEPRHLRFLAQAYEKMMRTLLTVPVEEITEITHYSFRLVVVDYLEAEGLPSYRDTMRLLMQRFAGPLYLRGRKLGALLRILCGAICDGDPRFFDDIPRFAALPEGPEKRAAILDYAEDCGCFLDFGRIKMNLEHLDQTRSLFEDEYRMMTLHTVTGCDDLRSRPSTEAFADVALGHHRWYNGADGYPEEYVRTQSPYRQMTDAAAVAVCLLDEGEADPDAAMDEVIALAHRRFSPLVTAFLGDPALRQRIRDCLQGSEEPWYREVWDQLQGRQT